MNKIPNPFRLFSFPLLLSLVLFAGFTGCKSPSGDCDVPINKDTVVSHVIPIQLAREYTANFRASIDSFNKNCPTFKDSMRFGHAEGFPSDVIRALLQEENAKQGKAVGVRIYFGRDTNGEIKLVLVPYDAKGNDMIDHIVDLNGKPIPGISPIRAQALKVGDDDGQAAEDGQRCPPACDDGQSGLN